MENNERIIVEFPPHLKGMASAVQSFVDEVEGVRGRNAKGGAAVDYEAVENRYADLSAKIETEAHGATLSSLDIQARRVRIGGRLYHAVGRFPADFRTQSGAVPVTRTLYREAGVRNGPTADPIALRIGAVEDHWLPGTAKAIAFYVQQGTSREADMAARQIRRLPYSRSSMERIGHAVGAVFVAEHADIEDQLMDVIDLPREAASVSASVDRVSLPMEEPRPRPEGPLRKNAPKNPISRVYRMAYCGTVTLHDAQGEALRTFRYGWTPGTDTESIADRLARDVMWISLRMPDLKLALLADGAEDMWSILDRYINKEWQGTRATRLIDFWHVVEKLGAASQIIFGNPAARKDALVRWKTLLLKKGSAVEAILEELYRSGKEWKRVGDEQPVHAAITYLQNHRDRMKYHAARKAGLPIASGNIEATCKSLVEVRMKRPGSRWKEKTAQHIMALRAAGLSDLWDPAISMALATLRTSVRKVA